MKRYLTPLLSTAAAWALVAARSTAEGHGIAGNRYFPGTLSFDDPAVADELVFQPTWRDAQTSGGGRGFVDNTLAVSFARLLTSRLAIGADTTWIYRDRTGESDPQGFGTTSVNLKGLVYENDPHETLLSAGLTWRIGGSGSNRVGGDQPTALEPGLFFGKGLGDLPSSWAWLRPFGVAGAVSLEVPTRKTWVTSDIGAATGQGVRRENRLTDTLHWGFALEYSTLYLTSRFTGAPPTQEPLDQLVPLVEVSFDTPLGSGGGPTTGSINPGLSYVGKVYQVALEVSVPINQDTGQNVGVRAQLLLFLDDFLPALFEKPLLGGH